MGARVLTAMSGGVDSSAAACLLVRAGYDVTGVTLRLYPDGDACGADASCRALRDARDARAVCDKLGIGHIVLDFHDLFHEAVISRFIADYRAGKTPNPCVDCNRFIKFGALLSHARRMGFDLIATGHYAKISLDPESGRRLLFKAADPGKDQSYVLYMLPQDTLRHTLFPLGGLTKDEVRALAAENGFSNAGKPESQDICFVPDGDYASFIERQTGEASEEGDFVDGRGNVLGRHRGLIRYTVGQRRGLGVSSDARLYVLSKDPEKNTVTLGPGGGLGRKDILVGGVNLIARERLEGSCPARVKIRYRQPEQPARLIPLPDGRVRVEFDAPQRGVAAGQAAVFYENDRVLGGGTIL